MAATVFGTHDIRDLQPGMLVDTVGQNVVYDFLDQTLAIWNANLQEILRLVGRQTTEYAERVNREGTGKMMPEDEFSRLPQRKSGGFESIYYPLKGWGDATGWTRDYLIYAKVEDLLREQKMLVSRDVRTLQDYLLGAFMRDDEYTYSNKRPAADLAIKPFVNGDAFIPPQWNSTVHTAPHTHYLGTAAAAIAYVDYAAMYTHLYHHGFGQNIELWISQDLEETTRALDEFAAVLDPQLVYPAGTITVPVVAPTGGNPFTFGNRIGRIAHMDVYVQAFMPDNYAFAFDRNQGPPLVERVEEAPILRGLRIVSQETHYPLERVEYKRRIGYAVANRLNGVVMNEVADATYVKPTDLEYE